MDYLETVDANDVDDIRAQGDPETQVSFRGLNGVRANLAHADFHEADCRNAVFTRAQLYAANFHGAILRGADLHTADCSSADFSGADLRGASFGRANLDGAIFAGALLNYSDHQLLYAVLCARFDEWEGNDGPDYDGQDSYDVAAFIGSVLTFDGDCWGDWSRRFARGYVPASACAFLRWAAQPWPEFAQRVDHALAGLSQATE